jgi:hypothetical protein
MDLGPSADARIAREMSWVKVEGVTRVGREGGCEGMGEAMATDNCGCIVVGNDCDPGALESPMERY